MATKEGKPLWDPYETSHGRHFTYQPNSAAEIFLYVLFMGFWCPASTPFIGSYSQSVPYGSTVYNKDFCWKPACKPECIRTGTASGQRRNNPHPSQSFMMWRVPRDTTRRSEYVSFPWKRSPSESEICEALTAQYHSTYRCDFMGMPQGYDRINNAERRCAPKHSRREVLFSTDTEMRDSYRQPKQKRELQSNLQYNPNVACRVPTVVQRHIHTQQRGSDVTSCDRFCGKRVTNVTRVIKCLLPQELQQLHRFLPQEEKEDKKNILNKNAHPYNGESKLPALALNSRSPECISSWPGPL